MKIREEKATDHKVVEDLIHAAFKGQPYSDQSEHMLVRRLRKSPAFIPGLSLVAEDQNRVIGHILFTRIKIAQAVSLALAPVSVHPQFHNRGVGSALINEGHKRARDIGYGSVMLLGHAQYYRRFGYQKASDFHISFPFEAPDDNCMAIELIPGALSEVQGEIAYSEEFY